MSRTITIRLTDELAEWLAEAAARSGVSQGSLIREQLERLRARGAAQGFLRLAGRVRGPRDLSDPQGNLARRNGVADTGCVVVLANRDDVHHD